MQSDANSPLTIDGFGPLPVDRPETVAALCDLVQTARHDQHALYPIGGRTRLHFGLPPTRPGRAVETTALAQVLDYPARDMTITVGAGITIARLHDILAEENRRVPGSCHARRRGGGQCQWPASLRLRHPTRLRHRHQCGQ